MSFYTEEELNRLGFKSIGKNVLISDKSSIYGHERISIGDFSRIDDFTVLSAGDGGIEIGRNVHIAVFSSLIGAGKIGIGDFSNISSRVSIYSSNDDYSGGKMSNPTIPLNYSGVTHQNLTIGRHVIVGSGSVILPSGSLDDGVAVGALSFVNARCSEWSIYAGNPAKKIKDRKQKLLKFEAEFLKNSKNA